MNKYLEKLASWKNPAKFVGYVTGATKRDAGAKVKHMEEAIANKYTLDDLKKNKGYVEGETIKARAAAGVAGAAAIGGTTYGYKKVRDKQRQETIARYNELLKGASASLVAAAQRKLFKDQKEQNIPDTGTMPKIASTASAAGEIGRGAASGVGNILRTVGRTTVDLMNSAGGGKIKDRAIRAGMKYNSKPYKSFVGASPRDQVKELLKRQPTANRKDLTSEVVGLHKHRRDAKIAIGTGIGAGVSGYGWHKAREALKKNNPKYY